MNPLNRRMFRQPGMSRQPAGILASSPQLANTVANRQPVRMANGGMNNSTFTAAVQRAVQAGDKYALQELAKPVNYGAAARTPDGQNALRLARQAIAQSTQISTDAAVDVPVSFAKRGIQGPPNIDAMGNVNTSTDDAMQAAMQANVDTSGPSLLDRGIAAAKGVGKDIANAVTVSPSQIEDPSKLRTKANVSDRLSSIFNYRGALRPAKEIQDFEITTNKSLVNLDDDDGAPPKTEPDEIFPGEQLAQNTVIGKGSQSVTDGTDPDADASITNNDVIARKVGTVDPDAPPPKGGAQDAKKSVGGGRLMDSIYGSTVKTSELTKTLEADINKVLTLAETGRTEDKKATDAATARLKKATDVFDKALGTKMAEAKEFNLEDVRDEALKISGVDDSNYDESRKDAFWMGLMRAGLAIAAGESDNALSNVAKGLGVGLEGYGKDIATLNEQEREDRKEIRAISMDLIKTKNAREIALATAKNDYTFNQQRLAQAAVQGADAAVIAAQNRENTNKLTGLQLQANLNLQLATRKADDKKLAVDTAYKQWAAEISMLPTEAKQALMFGPVEYDENGSIKLSALQEKEYKKILEASTTNKTTVTDTLRSITNAAANGQIRGVKLSDDSTTAQVQSSQWFSVYQKEYENAAKDPLIDENKILDAFAKDIGGTAPSGSGNNTLQPGQVIDISNHPQKDSLMTQKENEPFKIKGVDVVRKGSTIVALSPTK